MRRAPGARRRRSCSTVANSVLNPGVRVTSPAAGTTVSGPVTLTASASDISGIVQLKWYVDGVEAGWDGAAPWQVTWSSTSVANGTHTIFAKAQTGLGLWISSPATSFSVQNGTPTPAPKWTLLVSDDFDGATLDTTKWKVYGPNWQGHNGNGLRDGRAASLQSGALTITAQMLNGVLVSGGVQSCVDQRYGRYEFRVRTDADPWAATSGCVAHVAAVGELADRRREQHLRDDDRQPLSVLELHPLQRAEQAVLVPPLRRRTQWHTMAMEWEPDAIRIYRDGSSYGRSRTPTRSPTSPITSSCSSTHSRRGCRAACACRSTGCASTPARRSRPDHNPPRRRPRSVGSAVAGPPDGRYAEPQAAASRCRQAHMISRQGATATTDIAAAEACWHDSSSAGPPRGLPAARGRARR